MWGVVGEAAFWIGVGIAGWRGQEERCGERAGGGTQQGREEVGVRI